MDQGHHEGTRCVIALVSLAVIGSLAVPAAASGGPSIDGQTKAPDRSPDHVFALRGSLASGSLIQTPVGEAFCDGTRSPVTVTGHVRERAEEPDRWSLAISPTGPCGYTTHCTGQQTNATVVEGACLVPGNGTVTFTLSELDADALTDTFRVRNLTAHLVISGSIHPGAATSYRFQTAGDLSGVAAQPSEKIWIETLIHA